MDGMSYEKLSLSIGTSYKIIEEHYGQLTPKLSPNHYSRVREQMFEAKKCERAVALMKVKELCKEFGSTTGMLKGALAEGGSRR